MYAKPVGTNADRYGMHPEMISMIYQGKKHSKKSRFCFLRYQRSTRGCIGITICLRRSFLAPNVYPVFLKYDSCKSTHIPDETR